MLQLPSGAALLMASCTVFISASIVSEFFIRKRFSAEKTARLGEKIRNINHRLRHNNRLTLADRATTEQNIPSAAIHAMNKTSTMQVIPISSMRLESKRIVPERSRMINATIIPGKIIKKLVIMILRYFPSNSNDRGTLFERIRDSVCDCFSPETESNERSKMAKLSIRDTIKYQFNSCESGRYGFPDRRLTE
jgi:hypothetical protein